MPAQPTARPGGRTARTRQQVLAAVRRILVDGGPSALTMDAVARTSCVNRSTLYRRWGTVEAMVADLAASIGDSQPTAAGADLVADLCQLADQLAVQLNDEGRRLTRALLGWQDGAVEAALKAFWQGRITRVAEALTHHGVDADPSAVTRTLAGPLFYRALMENGPIDNNVRSLAVQCALAMVKEGMNG